MRIKNAQGLKLSRAPSVMVRMGRDNTEIFILPMNGILMMFSLNDSF
jgi:hypothetical protein